MTRKSFLKVAGLGAAAVAVMPVVSLAGSATAAKSAKQSARLRIAPVAGRKYSASFNRLSQQARFGSVNEILRRVKNRRAEFVVKAEEKTISCRECVCPNTALLGTLNPGSSRG